MSTARLALAATLLATGALAQSPMSPTARPPAPPSSPAQPTRPAADMQAVLDAWMTFDPKPIETLTPQEARMQASVGDGANRLMMQQGMPTDPDPAVSMTVLGYGRDPMQAAIVYKPVSAMGGAPLPVIVYYHGGGWVIADVHTYDATPRFLSKQLNAIVVSVEYRHAPEAKFPAQHEDAAAAYKWALDNAASWGGDPTRVALAGESAGGNLAVATAIYARDHGLAKPRHVLAVYPIANSDETLPSKQEQANAKPLNSAMLKWFTYYWSRTKVDAKDPRIDLVNADLKGLPPVTIVNAEIDPLLSDGETLGAALRRAGVPVEQHTFNGVTHEFFGLGKVVKGAYDAEAYAVRRLQPALAGR